MDYDKIIVLNLGSQTNQLIARRIRELGVFSELYPHTLKASEIVALRNVKGIVLSGGPASVYEQDALNIDPDIFTLNIPLLGICYGMQLMVNHFGGKIERTPFREYGGAEINLSHSSRLFNRLSDVEQVWMSHGDHVRRTPETFRVIAKSTTCEIAAIEHVEKALYGVQFHPEVSHTLNGNRIIENFVFDIAKAHANWTMEHYIDREIDTLRNTVKDQHVILGLSGGVDSSVAALLVSRALKQQLTCIFVDHGFLRDNEAVQVMKTFNDHLNLNVIKVDAQKTFLDALQGIIDPEQKRKIIGRTFIEVFEQAALSIDNVKYLAQGTLYTDVIESGGDFAHTIKSHHNVGGLPAKMKLKLIEPLNKLFKDEVRVLGKTLGMPDEIVFRQPFPGPGLAIRIIGEVTPDKLKMVRLSDKILHEVFKQHGLNETVWQYFTVLTSMKTVGVMGDQRSYDYVIAIRAVTSLDGLTADWAKIPHHVLEQVSRRIVNEVHGINRVVYDITAKPPGTIEWE